jgi:hypothetical protein
MTRQASSLLIEALKRKSVSTLRCFGLGAISLFLSSQVATAQPSLSDVTTVKSVSGQFTVTGRTQFSPLLRRPDVANNTNLVRLEPALLAVSAERFRATLWPLLGIRPDTAWNGKIFLALRPARTTADDVNLNIIPLPQTWNYRLELPDLLPRQRYARALTAAMLLEIANRPNRSGGRSAELPPWLVDGLGQLVLASAPEKMILSAPDKKIDGVRQSRTAKNSRGPDPLASARETLKYSTPPGFDDLCWPTGIQLDGLDDGAYLAGAQLFTSELLGLKNGPEMMRDFLARLSGCLNWQTAFYAAYHEHFRRPLDVEKWWALRVVRFAARDRGPRWSAAASRDQLANLLAVPVEFRASSNALPEHTTISLQTALKNFTGEERENVLRLKQRDLELAQFRLSAPYSGLADGYRAALAEFLGDKFSAKKTAADKRGNPRPTASISEIVKKMDALDARRREFEQKLDANPLPRNTDPTRR